MGGYEEIVDAVARRGDPAVAEVLTWADSRTPDGYDPESFDVDRADVDRAHGELAPRPRGRPAAPNARPGPWRPAGAGRARLDQPALVDAESLAAAVRPFQWLLHHVGDGVPLTAAG
ncbi:hypothetical protein [Georgenia yuyongxinii]